MASYLSLPKVANNDATAPDSAATSVTGDIDLRIDCASDDWTGAATQYLLNKATGGLDHSWFWWITTAGKIQSAWVVSDDTKFSGTSTTDITTLVGNGGRIQIRITRVAASGLVSFYYRIDTTKDLTDETGWTADGTSTPASGNIDDTAGLVGIGAIDNDTTNLFDGKFYAGAIYDGISGTLVFHAKFTEQPAGTTSFAESSSEGATVTVNQSGGTPAEIVEDPLNRWDNYGNPPTTRENRVFDTRVRPVGVRKGRAVSTTPYLDYD
jgi:hypothetical protein